MQRRDRPGRLLRELGFPLADTTVLIAIGCFTLLTLLVLEAGILGLWLGVILLPALWRYLLMLLEARAHGQPTPVAGIETFNPIDNFWSLTLLVPVALSIWGSVLLHRQVSPLAGQALAILLTAVLPASAAVLALTRSPLESLDPRAIVRMVAACGPAYALAPLTLVLGSVPVALAGGIGAPPVVPIALAYYTIFLLFSLTGALLHRKGVQRSISIPEPLPESDEVAQDLRLASRRRVINHAYGFFARDNRSGCMAHLTDALREEADDDDAWRWYLGEMFRWESKDGALMLGQLYLHRLLAQGRDIEALKLMSRCLLEDPRFRPLPGDLGAARELVERMNRADLARAMDLAARYDGR